MISQSFSLREASINALLGTRGLHVLNANLLSKRKLHFEEISESLTTAMLTFKNEMMDSTGKHLDYAGLRASRAYLHYKKNITPQLQRIDLNTFSSPSEQLAFWINLYNSLTIDAVISFAVSKSVMEGWLGILRFFRRAAYNVGGSRFSLEDIEHGVLRANKGHTYLPGPQFSARDPRRTNVVEKLDPRIHFALNCASRSCPPIGVYKTEKLDQELDLAAHNFIQAETRLSKAGDHLLISSIFKWYWNDFGGLEGIRTLFLGAISQDDQRYSLLTNNKRNPFRFLPYDWALNL